MNSKEKVLVEYFKKRKGKAKDKDKVIWKDNTELIIEIEYVEKTGLVCCETDQLRIRVLKRFFPGVKNYEIFRISRGAFQELMEDAIKGKGGEKFSAYVKQIFREQNVWYIESTGKDERIYE